MSSLDLFLQNHPALNRDGAQVMTRAVWGGIAKEFDALKEQVKIVAIDPAEVGNISGEMLDELIMRTIGIPRITNESDESRIKLLYVFFRRAGALSWATPHSIKSAYSYYFPLQSVYVLENAIETDLLIEGSFEGVDYGEKTAPFSSWVPSGSSVEVVKSVGFQGAKSLKLTGTGAVYQDVSIAAAGPVVVSGAYKGALPLSVQRTSDNKYWNFATDAWQAGAVSLALANASEAYALMERVVTMQGAGTLRVTYGPPVGGAEALIDYLSVGMKPIYPYIKVIVATFGQGGDYLNAWPGTTDPVAGTDYTNATFFGLDYVGGEGGGVPTAYYQQILDYIKPAGVKALFEFVGRV